MFDGEMLIFGVRFRDNIALVGLGTIEETTGPPPWGRLVMCLCYGDEVKGADR